MFFGRSSWALLFIYFHISVASNFWRQVGSQGKEEAHGGLTPPRTPLAAEQAEGCN